VADVLTAEERRIGQIIHGHGWLFRQPTLWQRLRAAWRNLGR
jgi:hypothetical protein